MSKIQIIGNLYTIVKMDVHAISSNFFDGVVEVEGWKTYKTNPPRDIAFSFEIDINDPEFVKQAEKFQRDVLEKSAEIKIKNGSVKYCYKRGEATFTLGILRNTVIVLRRGAAPECLREALSDMFCFDKDSSEEAVFNHHEGK
jgi:hypothetical protein